MHEVEGAVMIYDLRDNADVGPEPEWQHLPWHGNKVGPGGQYYNDGYIAISKQYALLYPELESHLAQRVYRGAEPAWADMSTEAATRLAGINPQPARHVGMLVRLNGARCHIMAAADFGGELDQLWLYNTLYVMPLLRLAGDLASVKIGYLSDGAPGMLSAWQGSDMVGVVAPRAIGPTQRTALDTFTASWRQREIGKPEAVNVS